MSQTGVKERPDEITCRGGRWAPDPPFLGLRCNECGRRQGPEDGSKPREGDLCPSIGKRKELYVLRIDHYQWSGTYNRLDRLKDDRARVRVLRSSGGWTTCTIKAVSYFHVCVKWDRKPDGKGLQKTVDIDKFIQHNPAHFADLPNATGPSK